jgi:hypothetical protein
MAKEVGLRLAVARPVTEQRIPPQLTLLTALQAGVLSRVSSIEPAAVTALQLECARSAGRCLLQHNLCCLQVCMT